MKNSIDDKIGWNFDNTYVGLSEKILTKIKPVTVKEPKLLILNKSLAENLGLNFSGINKDELASIFSGNELPKNSNCIAQAYAGHQFGHFTTLGDGRAVVLGEHITKENKRFDIQFKGSGRTPYSRHGDGRAALGPMLREYIISEAINSLGIPTTRSLAVVSTGEMVFRETPLRGAILTRVASSHIRVGTFQYVALTGDEKAFKSLLNYTVDRHYPEIKNSNNIALELLKIVIKKQCDLVTNWMRVGFIHGVMNTDNMAISGESIDYGPCAFMDNYDLNTVFSSIDRNGRYAYGNQPTITKWNLARFAETLLPYIDKDKDEAIKITTNAINEFDSIYEKKWNNMMKAKLGLIEKKDGDKKIILDLLNWMENNKADYTNTFLYLLEDDFKNNKIYEKEAFIKWYKKWKNRINNESLLLMRKSNPSLIPRNHIVENVLKMAEQNDLKPLNELLKLVKKPYEKHNGIDDYQKADKNSNKYQTFCGT